MKKKKVLSKLTNLPIGKSKSSGCMTKIGPINYIFNFAVFPVFFKVFYLNIIAAYYLSTFRFILTY